jgi:parallel beta-helix repeat protein/predicted outer membrane repeat protein
MTTFAYTVETLVIKGISSLTKTINMKKIFLLIIVIFFINASRTVASTSVPGGLVSGAWTLAGSPYLIQGNIQIPSGSTLIIEPGVTVNFEGAYKLNVQGQLLAIGTVTDTITFTATNTVTGWKGIRFDNTPATNDTSKIKYCKIQYGKTPSTPPDNYGGAFFLNYFSKIIISNCSIVNNSAFQGSGIYCYNSSPVISHNILSYNTTNLDGGGAIYCDYVSNPVISYNTISYNSAKGPGARSGGISCLGGHAEIINNIIINNSSEMNGGGFYCDAGFSGNISNNLFSGNSTSVYGGAIYCQSIGSPTFSYNFITNNTASKGGGFFFTASSNSILSENIICNNTASSYGGGICLESSSVPKITNSTITNNSASNGGALYCDGSSVPVFKNCILYGNTSSNSGAQVFLSDDGSEPNFYYCDVQGGLAAFELNGNFYTGTYQNNIDSDPKFVSPSGGSGTGFDGTTANWSLQSSSPCIDKGDPSGTYSTTDYAGNPRLNICRIDIGAYEYQLGIPFAASLVISQPISCYGTTGEITAVISGGTAPYNYLWSNGQTAAIAVGLTAGNYTVTVSDPSEGCTLTKSITLTQPLATSVFAGIDTTITCGSSAHLYAKNNWINLNSGINGPLYSVFFNNTDTGYAVGGGGGIAGTIYKTTNGGGNWTAQTNGAPDDLYSVYFTDDNTGYVAGDAGTILKTTNGGITWTTQSSRVPKDFRSIFFTDANTGYVAGDMGTILKTTNGGSNWVAQTSNSTNYLYSVYFTDADTGYVAGDAGTILKTTNGGTNWTVLSSGVYNVSSIYFTDANTGYVVGGLKTILKTTDGGSNWTVLSSGAGWGYKSVYFTDANTGYVVGSNGSSGIIFKTTNGGTNWIQESIGAFSIYLNSIHFPNNNTGYVVGTGGAILKLSIPVSYSWSPANGLSATNIANPIASPTATTSYIVSATSENGCIAKDTVTVFVNPLTANAGIDKSIFCGGSAQLDNVTTNYTGTGTLTYHWSPANNLNDSTISNPIVSPIVNTKYFVTVATPNSCIAIDSVFVSVYPLSVNAGSDKNIICGGSIQLDNVTSNYTGTGILSYNWSPTTGLNNDTILNPTATVTTNTKYIVTVTTPNGCIAIDSMTVFVNPLTANAGSDKNLVCGGSIQLDNVTSNYTGTGILSYNWSPTTGLNNDTILNPTSTVTSNTKYFITVTTPNGCTAIDSVTVFVNPLTADAGLDKNIICGGSIQLDNIISNYTGTGILSYNWSPVIGLNYDTIPNPIATITNNAEYFVTVTTPNGCIAIDSVTVFVNPLTANTGPDKNIICGDTAQLDNVFSNYTGTGILSYNWSPATGLNYDTVPNPSVSISGNMTYTVTVTTPNGCSATDNVSVLVIPMNAPEICLVGVDSINKNLIVWNKPASYAIDSFYIYRETNITNVYQKIGAVNYDSLSVFADTSSHPDIQSNKYKISIKDSCGLESAVSAFHKTMHLTINQGSTANTWNLIWEAYQGFIVSTYNVYRGTIPNNLQLIGTSSGSNTQYTDPAAPSGDIYYQVEVVSPNNCNPSKSYNSSRSNIATNKPAGIDENNNASDIFSIYPNPSNESITIDITANSNKYPSAKIYSIDGKLLKIILITQKKTEVNISDLPAGIYTIKVTSEKNTSEKMLVKE